MENNQNNTYSIYGNVTFGEITDLLIDIIGENVILALIPTERERNNYREKLRLIYKGECVYQKLATAEPNSPQYYFAQFFKGLESKEKYQLPRMAMILIDSFTWQLFYALRSYTPFERLKKDSVLFLIRKELFNLIHDLIIGEDNNEIGKIENLKESILELFNDSYEKIFIKIDELIKSTEEINKLKKPRKSSKSQIDFLLEKAYKENKNITHENIEYYFYEHADEYNKIESPDFKKNIYNWRKENNNPTWKTLELILDYLNDKDKSLVYRIIRFYLFNNTKKALAKVLKISEPEQENIINDIKTMLNKEEKDMNPENFYDEDNSDLIDYANLIFMCQTYQHLPYWNKNIFCIETLNNIIKLMESRCINSSVFFSPWLEARSLLFNKIETLSKKEKKYIVENYKKAYDYGLAYAGEYLCQFLLEAIILNKYFYPTQVKNINDLFGYSDALEILGDDKKLLLEIANKTDNILKEIVSVHYCKWSPMGKMIYNNCPQLQEIHSITEINYEAKKLHNKGLGYKKFGNLEEAVINYSAAIILCPISAETYFNRGLAYAELGKQYYGNALRDFCLTILFNPNDHEAYFNRGNIYAYTGNKEKANEDLKKVMEINPDYIKNILQSAK